ncbi:hypothetical protein M231_00781 [Tremella mesenterica]|uniref:Uncharacterized protein n=1 Tax=Tremella mesenterica TaxID=5217 RepID=A0A4Q1BV87_TREME|nr:hypothetical protein M231_00781 [Tremella mesenterica]
MSDPEDDGMTLVGERTDVSGASSSLTLVHAEIPQPRSGPPSPRLVVAGLARFLRPSTQRQSVWTLQRVPTRSIILRPFHSVLFRSWVTHTYICQEPRTEPRESEDWTESLIEQALRVDGMIVQVLQSQTFTQEQDPFPIYVCASSAAPPASSPQSWVFRGRGRASRSDAEPQEPPVGRDRIHEEFVSNGLYDCIRIWEGSATQTQIAEGPSTS